MLIWGSWFETMMEIVSLRAICSPRSHGYWFMITNLRGQLTFSSDASVVSLHHHLPGFKLSSSAPWCVVSSASTGTSTPSFQFLKSQDLRACNTSSASPKVMAVDCVCVCVCVCLCVWQTDRLNKVHSCAWELTYDSQSFIIRVMVANLEKTAKCRVPIVCVPLPLLALTVDLLWGFLVLCHLLLAVSHYPSCLGYGL